jgi:hypothetical protein
MRGPFRIDSKRPFALQTLITMHLYLLKDGISQRFRYFLASVKLPPTTASIGTLGGNFNRLRVHFGNKIRKRMGLPPLISLSFLFYPTFTAFRTVTVVPNTCYYSFSMIECQ